MDSINIYLKVLKEEAAFICSALEGYEGMAAVRTPNPDARSKFATLQVMVSPDFKNELENILQALSSKVEIERVLE